MTELGAEAIAALMGDAGRSPADAVDHVPPKPGLYAIKADAAVWVQLGLGEPPDARPLYVGKAERSLQSRDLKTHFETGKTGSSTVRRSLAALLVDQLELIACPRNVERPDGSANYGLEPASDEALTRWMHDNVRLAVWRSPEGCVLDRVETEVLTVLRPPLNIDKVQTPWRADLKARRAVLAAASRAWLPPER